ncbi:MAG TPA: aminopeptidase, partial [Pseudomonadales bacterium]|nr:aminopeptidase [Pseudomonadales bacterium]
AHGQWQILHEKKPIKDLIADPQTAPPLKHKFELILAARDFAKTNLSLKVDDAYSEYADLKRPYVVWNIVATEEFSTEPEEFCFPIAGCLRYKGYFDEAMARRDAEALKAENHDVYLGGVAAYSSLGWFADPILNTFINRDDAWLVALIFHESTHRTLYFPGDSRFNESLATAVEQTGLKQWMAAHGTPAQLNAYQVNSQRQVEFVTLVGQYKNKLDDYFAYSQTLSLEQRRAGKAAIYADLNKHYVELRNSWGGYSGYDNWFNDNLNNAKLSAVATYNDLTPLFNQLLEKLNYNYAAFFDKLRTLEKHPPDQRISELHHWLQ